MQLTLLTSMLMIGASMAAVLHTKSALDTRQVGGVDGCIPGNDCCFSTIGACKRQARNFLEANLTCNIIDFCPSLGITYDDCRADCCSISGKAGRGCPGK